MNSSHFFDFLAELVVGTDKTSVGRFALNPLFDQNLIPIILRDFAKSMDLWGMDFFGHTFVCNLSTGEQKEFSPLKDMTNYNDVRVTQSSPNGKMVACVHSTSLITVRELHNHQRIIHSFEERADSLAFSFDSKNLAAATNDRYVVFYDLKTGHKMRSYRVIRPQVSVEPYFESIIWSPNGSCLASICSNSSLCIWDAQTGDVLKHFAKFRSPLIFSTDGSIIAVRARRHVGLLNAQTFEVLHSWSFDDYFGRFDLFFDLSPDVSMIIRSFSNKDTFISDVKTGNDLHHLQCATLPPDMPVDAVSWSRDGSMIAIAYQSGDIMIWETRTFQIISSYHILHKNIAYLSFFN